jgi:D-alanine-D-alanine ligase-like ATP-grasp enzyme
MNTHAVPDRFVAPASTSAGPAAMLLRIEEAKHFTGANLHAAASALWVRIAVSEAARADDSKNRFLQRLNAAGISGSAIAARSAGVPPGLMEPLGLFASALAEVQAQGIIQNTRCQPQIISCQSGDNALAVTWPDEAEARQAVVLVLDVFNRASEGPIEALRSYVSELAEKADEPSLSVTLKAAEDCGIPWSWNEGIGYYQLGHGRHRTRIEATITGKLSAVGVHIVRRKSITNKLLRAVALPVPLSILTDDFDEAVSAAVKIRYPVVVKPMIGHKGEGITVGVSSTDELLVAFKKARNISRSVIVEQFIPGEDVRLLVVGRKLVAAAKRIPAQVAGDGKSTVAQLIAMENGRRSQRPGLALPIEIDSDLTHTLEGQGHSLNTVMPKNAVAKLRTVANWSQGGTATDLTDFVHPDNADMAVRAALAVGIDVAGVDFITHDISRPYYEVGGAICEINYRPGLRVHMAADPDGKHDIGSAIVESLISGDGRIDIVYVIDAGSGAFAKALAERFADAGKKARVACAYEAPEQWQRTIELSLDDPDCDALIVNAPASAIVKLGAGVEYCRLVVRFADGGGAKDEALFVLEKICKPENMLAAGAEENSDVAAACIAGVLGLVPKSREPFLPPAEISTSRDLLEIAGNRGLAAKELAYWNNRPLLQFGYGASLSIYRGRRTGVTSHIATRIADDKRRTNALLLAHGLPHSTQAVVDAIPAAVGAARRLGYPVIVKPTGSSESRGVTGNILNDDELAEAVAQAFHHSSKVIVEPFLKGKDHRFLIIGGKAAHVTRHETAQVTGDGQSTVEQLVARANLNPLRGDAEDKPYTLLRLEGDALRMLDRQGLSAKSVPVDGQAVMLSSICHLSTGGTAVDMTDVAHPDNIAAAERIARLIGLDICGIDFLHPDVTKSYKEVGGVILEVNQGPSFDMHDASTNSTNRIRSLILRELSDRHEGPQIPLLNCILNDDCPTEAVARSVILKMHSKLGLTVGAAVPALEFALIGAAIIKSANGEPTSICNSILADRRVEAALFLTGNELPGVIPESARIVDFRSSKHRQSVEDITDAIVLRFIEALD